MSAPPPANVDSGRVKVLLVGSGAREHALAWKFASSPSLTQLHAAPGNPGIAAIGDCHPVRADDRDGLLDLAHTVGVDLVVVGPEAPLVAGIADDLRHAGVAVFGPGAAAARIEGSKAFAKDVMDAAGVPTAARLDPPTPPCVVKADGLASGKGVFVCNTPEELAAGIEQARALGETVVVEELLEGPEVSLFALCDGRSARYLGMAQDYKRARDGDVGPNTGGMGAFSPPAGLDDAAELVARVHQPVLDELARRGAPFVGCLFAGLMLTDDGPRVLEFNARFGDPETQVLIPRFEGDLLDALAAAAHGRAGDIVQPDAADAAVTVVLTGPEYPARSDYAGVAISGIAEAEAAGALVFHGGTAMRGEQLVTNGGRILSVTARGSTVTEARERAYAAASKIAFDGARYRTDIAAGVH
jgi:phosphoribosylamine--glycine ligase